MANKIIGWVVFALLTALFGYMVIAAVGNLVLLPEMASGLGLSVNGIGWFWLWTGVAIPFLGFAVAIFAGLRRKGGLKLLILATALAVTAAVQLEVLHLVPQSSFFV